MPMSTGSPASASSAAVHALDCSSSNFSSGRAWMRWLRSTSVSVSRSIVARAVSLACMRVASHCARCGRNDRPAGRASGTHRVPRRLRRVTFADCRTAGRRPRPARRGRRPRPARGSSRPRRDRQRPPRRVPSFQSARRWPRFAGLYGMEQFVDGERIVDDRVLAYASTRSVTRPPISGRSSVSSSNPRRGSVSRCTGVRRPTSPRGGRRSPKSRDRYGLATLRTRMAVELRPPIAVDKGDAVRALVDGFEVGAFAGDDTGDLPAFAALARATPACGTRSGSVCTSEEAPPELPGAVDLMVDGPAGLVALLDPRGRRGRLARSTVCARSRVCGGAGDRGPLVERHRRARCRARPRTARCRTGCTAIAAALSSSYAPASGERHSTPSRRLHAGPSFATRLRPSRSGFTNNTSYRCIPATERVKSSRSSSTIGCQSRVAQRSLTRATDLFDLVPVREVFGQSLTRRVQHRNEHGAAAQSGPRFQQSVERKEPAHDVLRRLDAIGAQHDEPVADGIGERARRGPPCRRRRDLFERAPRRGRGSRRTEP